MGALVVPEGALAPELLDGLVPDGFVPLAFWNGPVYGVVLMPVPFLHVEGEGVPLVNIMSAH